MELRVEMVPQGRYLRQRPGKRRLSLASLGNSERPSKRPRRPMPIRKQSAIKAALGTSPRQCEFCPDDEGKKAPYMFVHVDFPKMEATEQPSESCLSCQLRIALDMFLATYGGRSNPSHNEKIEHLREGAGKIKTYLAILRDLNMSFDIDEIDKCRAKIYEDEIFNDLDPNKDFPAWLTDEGDLQMKIQNMQISRKDSPVENGSYFPEKITYTGGPMNPTPFTFQAGTHGKNGFLLGRPDYHQMDLHTVASVMRTAADAVDAAAKRDMTEEEKVYVLKNVYRLPFDNLSAAAYEAHCWEVSKSLDYKREHEDDTEEE